LYLWSMSQVSIRINGVLRTKQVQPLTNFTLYACEQNVNIHTHSANNVTTVGGLAAFKAILEGYITNSAGGHPAGTIVSSSITVNQSSGEITVDIVGTGDNSATKFPGSFFTQQTWDTKDQHTVSFQFLTGSEVTVCTTCQDATLPNCEEPVFSVDVEAGTYTASITDSQSGHVYTQVVTVADGEFTWDTTSSEGVFTPFSVYTLSMVDDNGEAVSWVVGTTEYDCIRFSFASFTDTTPQG
jgi:hypothetical protein